MTPLSLSDVQVRVLWRLAKGDVLEQRLQQTAGMLRDGKGKGAYVHAATVTSLQDRGLIQKVAASGDGFFRPVKWVISEVGLDALGLPW